MKSEPKTSVVTSPECARRFGSNANRPNETRAPGQPKSDSVMTAPEIKHRLETLGFVVPAPGGASYAKFVPSEIDLWTRVIKTAGIKPE